jgi:hypothetical protein
VIGTCPFPLWREARGQGAQYKMSPYCREALRHAQGRELCRRGPACLPRPNGVAGELQNKFSSHGWGTRVDKEFAEGYRNRPLPPNVKRTFCVPNWTRPRMLLKTPTLVSAFQIFCYLKNEGIINEMRKVKSKISTLINKTLFICQEKNNPVYVM